MIIYSVHSLYINNISLLLLAQIKCLETVRTRSSKGAVVVTTAVDAASPRTTSAFSINSKPKSLLMSIQKSSKNTFDNAKKKFEVAK
jgi:hypothetical protein